MAILCLACLAGLLVIGALIDIECRRLPNWLTASVAALWSLFVLASPTPVDWMGALAAGALVFAAGFLAFAFNVMGGGDVKLMAGLALWAGVDHVALFLLVTSLAGGGLAFAMMILRRWSHSPLLVMLAPLAGPLARKLPRPEPASGGSPATVLDQADVDPTLPYGVAIAAGGFAVIYALLQL